MAWIPAILLACVALCARYLSKSWLAPSAFFAGIWSAFIVLPLIVYGAKPAGVWVLFALVSTMSVGAMLAERVPPKESVPVAFPADRAFRWILIFSAVAMIGTVYFAFTELREFGVEQSLASLLLVGRMHRLTVENPPALVRILVTWAFPAAVLAGMAFPFTQTRKRKLLCFVPLIPAISFSILNAFRANTLILIVLGLSSYAATRVALQRKPTKKFLLRATAALILVSGFVYAIELVRANQADSEIAAIEMSRLRSLVAGHLPVFSYWIDHRDTYLAHPPALGVYTFGGLADVIGGTKRKSGVFQEFLEVEEDMDSNVYTAFRGAIEDFTLPGAISFFGLFGLSAGFAYSQILAGRTTWIPYLAFCFAFVIWSPVISLLNYNGPLLGALVGYAALKLKPMRWRLVSPRTATELKWIAFTTAAVCLPLALIAGIIYWLS